MTTSKVVYRGMFANNRPHGKGVMKALDGSWSYVGDFMAGLQHGKGKTVGAVWTL